MSTLTLVEEALIAAKILPRVASTSSALLSGKGEAEDEDASADMEEFTSRFKTLIGRERVSVAAKEERIETDVLRVSSLELDATVLSAERMEDTVESSKGGVEVAARVALSDAE